MVKKKSTRKSDPSGSATEQPSSIGNDELLRRLADMSQRLIAAEERADQIEANSKPAPADRVIAYHVFWDRLLRDLERFHKPGSKDYMETRRLMRSDENDEIRANRIKILVRSSDRAERYYFRDQAEILAEKLRQRYDTIPF